MKVSVTPLSAPAGSLAGAAAAAVAYVCGPESPHAPTGAGTYYADSSVEGPGRWLGNGAARFALEGAVDSTQLESLLRGEHPSRGGTLLGPRGSHGRARHLAASLDQEESAGLNVEGPDLTFAEAASWFGVDARYLRRVAGRTRAVLARSGGTIESLRALEADGRAFLIADQGADGLWRVARNELARFAAARQAARVVTAYDVTFSAPKSVSVLWARADAAERAEIVAAVDAATAVGVEFLERHACYYGRGETRQRGRGFTAAAFTHATSRNLDPQLHVHTLVANLTETFTGEYRALDGSGLYAYAKTAGYLAAAALRHELTTRLGVGWRAVRSGIAEVVGVPTGALRAMSTRSAEIEARAQALEIASAAGRTAVALRTRAPKPPAADLAQLHSDWRSRLDGLGFDAPAFRACLGSATCEPPGEHEIGALVGRLARHDGLTRHSPTFDRRDVIQHVVDWSGPRLAPAAVEELADRILASEFVVPLTTTVPLQLRRTSGQRAGAVTIARYTTVGMIGAECAAVNTFRQGLHSSVAVVDQATLHDAIRNAAEFSEEQRAAVRALCRSGHRVQCLVGPAGSGKTTTLRHAAAAWTRGGFEVMGLAVQGSAAERLAATTGIASETVASFLARAERDELPPAGLAPTRVLVVDEASALGTFDLARLTRAAVELDAKVVLVGDPAQHSAVTAGGAFAALVRHFPSTAAHLSEVHRQRDSATIASALSELRERDTDAALHRLYANGRIFDARGRDEAAEALVAHWYDDRRAAQADSTRAPSCMVVDDHATRRLLNRMARARLRAAGELSGPTLEVGGQAFQAGDEVMCCAPAPELHPRGRPDLGLRNGTEGRVSAVCPTAGPSGPAGLWVECEGRGTIFVPAEALAVELRPGVTGVLTHTYALTSHAAQGATFETARALTTDATSPAALYVAASRARSEVRLYTTRLDRRDPETEPLTIASRDTRTGLQAMVAALRTRGDERMAIEQDPGLLARFEDPALDAFRAGRAGALGVAAGVDAGVEL